MQYLVCPVGGLVTKRRRPASADVTLLGLTQEVENINNPFSRQDSLPLRNLRGFL